MPVPPAVAFGLNVHAAREDFPNAAFSFTQLTDLTAIIVVFPRCALARGTLYLAPGARISYKLVCLTSRPLDSPGAGA